MLCFVFDFAVSLLLNCSLLFVFVVGCWLWFPIVLFDFDL